MATIVGHSAGAHLALWGASRGRLGAPYTPRIKPLSVVAIDGPATLAPFIGIDKQACGGRSVITSLMGGTPAEMPDAHMIASPAEHLPLGVKQLLVQAPLHRSSRHMPKPRLRATRSRCCKRAKIT